MTEFIREKPEVDVYMMHPIHGKIEIKDTRDIGDRILAYFNGTVCDAVILNKVSKK